MDELVARAPVSELHVEAFRHMSPEFEQPLSGEGARRRGGRFNPPGSFAVLYLADDLVTVADELRRLGERSGIGVDSLLPRAVYAYRVDLVRVLDLRQADVRETLGVSEEDLLAEDRTLPQEMGESAFRLGLQAIVCQSAAGGGSVIAVFPALLGGADLNPHKIDIWETAAEVPGRS